MGQRLNFRSAIASTPCFDLEIRDYQRCPNTLIPRLAVYTVILLITEILGYRGHRCRANVDLTYRANSYHALF